MASSSSSSEVTAAAAGEPTTPPVDSNNHHHHHNITIHASTPTTNIPTPTTRSFLRVLKACVVLDILSTFSIIAIQVLPILPNTTITTTTSIILLPRGGVTSEFDLLAVAAFRIILITALVLGFSLMQTLQIPHWTTLASTAVVVTKIASLSLKEFPLMALIEFALTLIFAWSEWIIYISAIWFCGVDYWAIVSSSPSHYSQASSQNPQRGLNVTAASGADVEHAPTETTPLLTAQKQQQDSTGARSRDVTPQPRQVLDQNSATSFFLPDPMASSSIILDIEATTTTTDDLISDLPILPPHPSRLQTERPSTTPQHVGSAPSALLSPLSEAIEKEKGGITPDAADDEEDFSANALMRSYESAHALNHNHTEVVGSPLRPPPVAWRQSLKKKPADNAVDSQVVVPQQQQQQQPPDTSWSIHAEVAPAMANMWNGAYASALDALKVGGRHRFIPRNALHLAEVHVLLQACSGREEDRERCVEYLRVAEVVANKVLQSPEEIEATFLLSFGDTASTSLNVPPSTRRATRQQQQQQQSQNARQPDQRRLKTFRTDVEVCLADSLLLRGAFQILMGREIKGAFNLRKAWKLYLKLHADLSRAGFNETSSSDPNARRVDDCVRFGVAFFQIVMSIVPPSFSSVLRAIGLASDRRVATTTLLSVFEAGGVRAGFAAMVLLADAAFGGFGILRMRPWDPAPRFGAVGDSGDDREGGGVDVVEGGEAEEWARVRVGVDIDAKVLALWPDGGLVLLMSHHLKRRLGMTDKAIEVIQRAVRLTRSDLVPFPVALLYELGTLLAVKCEWARAREVFEQCWYGDHTPFDPSSSPRPPRRPTTTKTLSDDADWFETRPIVGALLVGCLRAEGGGNDIAALETARAVKADISAALSGASGGIKIKKTRYVKMTSSLVEWTIRRGAVHPLMIHCLLYLRRDLAQAATNTANLPTISSLLRSVTATSATDHATTADDPASRAVTDLIAGTLAKYVALMTPGSTTAMRSSARVRLGNVIAIDASQHAALADVVAWVVPHAGYEIAEFEALEGRWAKAQLYLELCLNGNAGRPDDDDGDVVAGDPPRASPMSATTDPAAVSPSIRRKASLTSSTLSRFGREAGKFNMDEGFVRRLRMALAQVRAEVVRCDGEWTSVEVHGP